MGADEVDQLRRGPALTHDLEPTPLEQARQSFAQQNVVIGQHDARATQAVLIRRRGCHRISVA